MSLTIDLPFNIFENFLRAKKDRSDRQVLARPASSFVQSGVDPMLGESDAEVLYLENSIARIERQKQHMVVDTPGIFQTLSGTWTASSSVLAALKSVVPDFIAEEVVPSSSTISRDIRAFTSPLHRQVLFSMANNFAGLGALDFESIIYFLQQETDETFYKLVLNKSCYSSRAIAQNLFKIAIETGNASIVDFLLTEELARINVNEHFCSIGDQKYTPIERASALRHKDLIKILLRHQADVNRSHPKGGLNGALDYAIGAPPRFFSDPPYTIDALDHAMRYLDDFIGTEYDKYTRVDPQVFQMLLEAGGNLSSGQLCHIIKRGDGEYAIPVISKNGPENFTDWSDDGIFLKAIKFLDELRAIEIIDIMLNVGADLNFRASKAIDIDDCRLRRVIDVAAQRGSLRMVELLLNKGASLSSNAFPWAVASGNEDLIRFLLQREADVNSGNALNDSRPHRAIDVAAQRGSLVLVELLLNKGASLSGDTFPCAVASGNEDLIQFLLDKGADINSIGSTKVTALAAAIRLENTRIINLLTERGARSDDKERFSAALTAASEVGNVAIIKDFVQLKICHPDDLGHALIIATRGGFDEVATMLIDAGANTNVTCDKSPLQIVLERTQRRNAALVYALLDADADCRYNSGAFQLAVQWGNRSVVEALLFAGADVDDLRVLIIAVQDRHYELVQLLLDAGTGLNGRDYAYKTITNTPLQAAAANGDMGTVHLLLDCGADPHDPGAFQEAFERNRDLFDLLINRHKARYPRGRQGFGSSQLAAAIKKGDENCVKALLELRGSGHMDHMEDVAPFGLSIFKEGEGAAGFTELFLLKGYDPNSIVARIYEGGSVNVAITAFLAAIGTGNSSTVELLIRYGAKVNLAAQGRVKRTPLQRAAEIGSREIVELLINHGAEVNAPAAARSGGTALQLAAIGGYIPIACMLLDRGADVDAPSSKVNGRSALEGAAENGRLDMVQLLLIKGAGCSGEDRAQFARAKALAYENDHSAVVELLESRIDYDYGDLIDWEGNGN